MIAMKKFASSAVIVGALGAVALGIGSGVANAAPPSPAGTGVAWAQDRGRGHDHGDWRGDDRRGWVHAPDYGYGPGYYAPPPPCVTGPFGFVHVCA
jgi:hypothetical protein